MAYDEPRSGPPGGGAPLPVKAADTTADRPWPVRHLVPKIADYIGRMSPVWVEGQVLNLKRWNSTYFLTLRDVDLDMSLRVTLPARDVAPIVDRLADGSRIVVHARPRFVERSGDLSFAADAVRLVGLGELLAQIERLKGVLAAERVRRRIEAKEFELEGGATTRVTASIGVAAFPDHGRDRETLLKLADELMYDSKRNGKNRVTVAGSERTAE